MVGTLFGIAAASKCTLVARIYAKNEEASIKAAATDSNPKIDSIHGVIILEFLYSTIFYKRTFRGFQQSWPYFWFQIKFFSIQLNFGLKMLHA